MTHRTRILDRMPSAQAELYRQILQDAGIDAEVVAGDLPGIDGWVTVPDEQVPLAEVALREAAPEGEGKQICPGCGESNPPAFVDCWSCGASLAGDGEDAQPFTDEVPKGSPAGRIAVMVGIAAMLAWLAARWWFLRS